MKKRSLQRRESRKALSGYRLMWMIVMFDLPVGEPQERKAASDFRFTLLDEGFSMAQFSVYFRFCAGQAVAEALSRRVAAQLPEGGKVDVLLITDRQYEGIRSYRQRRREPRKNPDQFVLL
jgi:CRISPR-associated protein Cas2